MLFAYSHHVSGQQDSVPKNRASYFNCFTAGPLIGSPKTFVSFSGSMTHGIRWHKTSFSLGTSFDGFQQWTTIPLTANITAAFLQGKLWNTSFGLSGGYVILHHKRSEMDIYHFKERGGHVIHPFISHQIRERNWTIYMNAGFKFQTVKYDELPRWAWNPSGFKNSVTRDMHRFCLQIGFGWR
jgi:hypothetical protein